MGVNQIKNVSIQTFRDFLTWEGLAKKRTNGGHEIWDKEGLYQPVVFQSHKKNVPEPIINKNLKTMGSSKERFSEFLKKAK